MDPFKATQSINYSKLVSPKWLKEFIDSSQYDPYNGNDYRFLCVGYGDSSQFNDGYIPGSMYIDTNKVESGPMWNIVPLDQFEMLLYQFGISTKTTVIVYGQKIMAATRVAWALLYAGVQDVRVLNGGLEGWKDLKFDINEKPLKEINRNNHYKQPKPQTKYLSTILDVQEKLTDINTIIVDVRSWEEYIGEASGYKYIEAKGRIPNARWGYSGSNPYHMEDYEDGGFLRSYEEIVKLWDKSRITPDKNIIFYCGTGWRASEAFYIAYLMGWPHISVYDGGWMEWSNDPCNPIKIGK
jgi:thiosulfate/3-mercaptopyruvate sulfurtransferase